MPDRKAQARWNGSLKEGDGTMSMASGAYEGAYSFQSRFEEGEGTNPEELLAAAHAGCFSMQLSGVLGAGGHDPESVETVATVHIEKAGEGFEITRIVLDSKARVPGIDEDTFQQAAETAKNICPVSVLFKGAEISLNASLES
jgi:osmotically inducible protein OsmC